MGVWAGFRGFLEEEYENAMRKLRYFQNIKVGDKVWTPDGKKKICAVFPHMVAVMNPKGYMVFYTAGDIITCMDGTGRRLNRNSADEYYR